MTPSQLKQIVPAATAEDLQGLLDLMSEIEAMDNLFAGFIFGHGNDNRFLYLGPFIETITGYPPAAFLTDTGFQFFYGITPPEYRAHIVERAAYYTRLAKERSFNTRESLLMEMHGGLAHRDGTVSKIRYLATVLEYTAERGILLSLCTWQKVDHASDAELATVKENIGRLLRMFKAKYVNIHPGKFDQHTYPKDDIVRVVYPLYQGPGVTKKEYQVLQLISNGYSSKKIADQLNISFHTAETHRKNLLGKFGAANTAELMKKATKVFWFE